LLFHEPVTTRFAVGAGLVALAQLLPRE